MKWSEELLIRVKERMSADFDERWTTPGLSQEEFTERLRASEKLEMLADYLSERISRTS